MTKAAGSVAQRKLPDSPQCPAGGRLGQARRAGSARAEGLPPRPTDAPCTTPHPLPPAQRRGERAGERGRALAACAILAAVPSHAQPANTPAKIIPSTVQIAYEDYPEASRAAGETGIVRVDLRVGADGAVQACAINASSGFPRLDEATCRVAARWRFTPAISAGQPIASTATRSLRWNLMASVATAGYDTPATPIARSFEAGPGDYPSEAMRAGQQGDAQVTVTVGPDGRVSECAITRSTGYPTLDAQTCRIAQARWRFKPATKNGQPVAFTGTRMYRWRLQGVDARFAAPPVRQLPPGPQPPGASAADGGGLSPTAPRPHI